MEHTDSPPEALLRGGAAAQGAHRARARHVLQLTVLGAPVVVFVIGGWIHRWITDDGFIYLRVVQQINAGNGPVFNTGERVEAFTGVLWVALLAVADLVTPIRLEWLAVLLGLTGGGAGVAFGIVGARRLLATPADDAWLVPFGALVFVAVLPAWVFATSGLETGLTLAWLGGCLWILAGWARSPHESMSVSRAVVLGLGWLVRPELVLFSAAFLLLILGLQWPQDRWRGRARFAAAMIGLPLAYQIFRMGFYGSVVPNTAVAKEAGSMNWERGWRYLSDFADPYMLWVPAVALLAGGYLPLVLDGAHRRRPLWVVGVFFVCAALHATYIVAVGGDYIHARLLLPAFFALCAPVAVVPAKRRHLVGLAVVPWAVAAVLSLRPPQFSTGNIFVNGFVLPKHAGKVTTDDFGWAEDAPQRRWFRVPAFYYQVALYSYKRVDIPLERDVDLPLAALLTIGLPSYAMGPDFHVLDVFGLADPLTAHLETAPLTTYFSHLAGHEKALPASWVAARLTPAGTRPTPDAFPTELGPLSPSKLDFEFQEQVAWARAALDCGEIAEIRLGASAPLAARRFVDNFLRSFSNTRARIPTDPEEAYHRFCGPNAPTEVKALRSG